MIIMHVIQRLNLENTNINDKYINIYTQGNKKTQYFSSNFLS